MQPILIKGLNLHLDPAIQEICETSNNTSGGTRRVLYIAVIVNVLILIAVLNTHKWNWTKSRMELIAGDIANLKLEKERFYTDTIRCNKLADSIRLKENILLAIKRSDIENYDTVKVPILGNAFDINNLGIVAGLTLCILLTIIRFTLIREINNLRIALLAITDRYTDDSDADKFSKTITEKKGKPTAAKQEVTTSKLADINFIRRQHHYNFLTMNEVFNLPRAEVSENKVIHEFLGRAVMRMFYLPLIIYSIVVINDLSTFDLANLLSYKYALVSMMISVLCLVVVFFLARKCTRQKDYLFALYSAFQRNNYKWNPEMRNAEVTTHLFGHLAERIRLDHPNIQFGVVAISNVSK